MFLSIGMLKQKYFLADIFILSAEKQPIKLSWRKIECLRIEGYGKYRNHLFYTRNRPLLITDANIGIYSNIIKKYIEYNLCFYLF